MNKSIITIKSFGKLVPILLYIGLPSSLITFIDTDLHPKVPHQISTPSYNLAALSKNLKNFYSPENPPFIIVPSQRHHKMIAVSFPIPLGWPD